MKLRHLGLLLVLTACATAASDVEEPTDGATATDSPSPRDAARDAASASQPDATLGDAAIGDDGSASETDAALETGVTALACDPDAGMSSCPKGQSCCALTTSVDYGSCYSFSCATCCQ